MSYISGVNSSSNFSMGTSHTTVGRNVARNISTSFSTNNGPATSTLADGNDVKFKSVAMYDDAKSIAKKGGRATSFKRADAFGSASLDSEEAVTIAQKGDYKVTYGGKDGNQLNILKKNSKTGKYDVISTVDAGKDAKISWNGSGDPTVLTGSAALTGGKLVGDGKDDILFRASNADVQAGEGTTVLNNSSSGGNFSGGNNVTYLGSYENAEFSDSEGKIDFAGFFKDSSFSKLTGANTYDGVFEGAEIDSSKSNGTFSGYFSETHITGDKKEIEANGLFLNGSVIEGSNAGDTYSGRFIDSEVDAGNGKDTFGHSAYTVGKEKRAGDTSSLAEEYTGVEADFINSQVNAGTGDTEFTGVMWGGNLDLDSGKNTVSGVFAEASVLGGSGDDSLSVEYSRNSTFTTGTGNNSIDINTSVESSVIAEDGAENSITLGANKVASGATSWQTSKDVINSERASVAGELKDNTIDIANGENNVAVNNGESSVTATSGNGSKETKDDSKKLDGDNSNDIANGENNAAADKGKSTAIGTSSEGAKKTEDGSKKIDDVNSNDSKVNKMAGRYSQISGVNPQDSSGTAAVISTAKDTSVDVKEAVHDESANKGVYGEVETMTTVNAFGNLSSKRFKSSSV